jgi:hypothetical protein
MTARSINLAVNCTASKTLSVPPCCRLGSLSAGGLEPRAEGWLQQLAAVELPRRTALELYSGAHWRAVRGILDRHSDVSVWVCSAGFGLVNTSARLCSYSATFSTGHPDSVGAPADRQRWWGLLAEWEGPEPGRSRSLAELARRSPALPLLVALSEPYLAATTADLSAAREQLARPELLSIICVGAPKRHPLAGHFLPVVSALRTLVGGALVSLNARLAARLFDEHHGEWIFPALHRRVARWTDRGSPPSRPCRRRLSDEEIRGFIRGELAQSPPARPATLLRRLRGLNLACEQGRFTRLFRQEIAGNGHNPDHSPQGAAPVAG